MSGSLMGRLLPLRQTTDSTSLGLDTMDTLTRRSSTGASAPDRPLSFTGELIITKRSDKVSFKRTSDSSKTLRLAYSKTVTRDSAKGRARSAPFIDDAIIETTGGLKINKAS